MSPLFGRRNGLMHPDMLFGMLLVDSCRLCAAAKGSVEQNWM